MSDKEPESNRNLDFELAELVNYSNSILTPEQIELINSTDQLLSPEINLPSVSINRIGTEYAEPNGYPTDNS